MTSVWVLTAPWAFGTHQDFIYIKPLRANDSFVSKQTFFDKVFVLVPVSFYKKASQEKVYVHRSQVRKTKTEFQLTQLTSILACQLFDWRAASSDWTASSFSVPGQCSLLKLRFKIGLWFVMKFTGPLPRFNPPELSLWQSKTSEGHWAPKPIKNSL